MKMKKMVYKSIMDLKPEERHKQILYEGDYKNHHFVILSLLTHPTAYVENKKLLDYNFLDDEIICHGGLTYGYYGSRNNWDDDNDHRHYIGWDYSHVDDWYGVESLDRGAKKWSTEEIYEEVKNVIEQLIKLEEK